MKRVLFLCSRNRLRSPTAEEIFRENGAIEVDSAGLAPDAEVPVTVEHLEWADLIIVMEKVHKTRLSRSFGGYICGKRVVVLDIPDKYPYMDADLVRILRLKCTRFLI